MAGPRTRGKYRAVNGCKRQCECEQVFWVFGMLVLLTLYSVFVASTVARWSSVAMKVFMAIDYLLFVPIIYDYLRLTCIDPVDPNIVSEQDYSQVKTKRCSLCDLAVKKTTEHCLICQRCTDNMDHHSQLVNNCVSRNQIGNYIRFNVCLCLATGIMVSQSVALFVMAQSDGELKGMLINQWAILLLVILTLLSWVFALANSLFSIYLSCKDITRINYRFRETDSNNSDYSESDNMEPNDGNSSEP